MSQLKSEREGHFLTIKYKNCKNSNSKKKIGTCLLLIGGTVWFRSTIHQHTTISCINFSRFNNLYVVMAPVNAIHIQTLFHTMTLMILETFRFYW